MPGRKTAPSGQDLNKKLVILEHETEKLRQEKDKYEKLLNNLNTVVYTLDTEARVTYVSENIEKLGGYTPSEILGRKFTEFVHPEDLQPRMDKFQEVLSGKEIITEYRYLTGTGGYIWIMNNASLLYKDGKIAGVQGILVDIDERKRTEEALRSSENYYRTIFENSASVMFIIEEDTTISRVNNNFEALLGYARHEVEGKKSWTEFIYPEDLPWMLENHRTRRIDPDAAPSGYEFRFMDRSSSLHHGFINVAMIPGTLKSMVSLIDVTEQKLAQQEKEDLRRQLIQSQMMETVGRLAGGVAHEFNNLFQILRGHVEIMEMDKPEGHPDKNRLKTLEGEINRGAHLISQLLFFSRRGRQSPRKETLFLHDHIKSLVNFLRQTILKKIDVQMSLDSDIMPVEADPDMIAQVLINICTNAAEAMPGGGSLVIEIRNAGTDSRNSAKQEDKPSDYVIMRITDTGPGMDEKTRQAVFEPFFTTKETNRGTGLGLAAAYGIIKNHGGEILCRSTPGSGTSFEIHLPAENRPL